jgi:Ca-activated chloride channel family protein
MESKKLRKCEFIGQNPQDDSLPVTGIPLKHQEVNVTVDNAVGIIDVVQTFLNDKQYPMEVTLKFPTEADHALSNLTIQIGEDVIEGKVMKKEKAKEKYEDAIASGNTAVMAEEKEDESDVVSLKVGNLLAGQEAVVRFRFLTMLKIECGAYVLKVPQSFFPAC